MRLLRSSVWLPWAARQRPFKLSPGRAADELAEARELVEGRAPAPPVVPVTFNGRRYLLEVD